MDRQNTSADEGRNRDDGIKEGCIDDILCYRELRAVSS
jgi:hypothetical protein